MGVRCVAIHGDIRTMVREEPTRRELLRYESLNIPLSDCDATANPIPDQTESLAEYLIHQFSRFQMRVELFPSPARLEVLNEIRRGEDFDAASANEFDSSSIHHRYIRNHAVRGVLHRDPLRSAQ